MHPNDSMYAFVGARENGHSHMQDVSIRVTRECMTFFLVKSFMLYQLCSADYDTASYVCLNDFCLTNNE
jgi:hypothetical protein